MVYSWVCICEYRNEDNCTETLEQGVLHFFYDFDYNNDCVIGSDEFVELRVNMGNQVVD